MTVAIDIYPCNGDKKTDNGKKKSSAILFHFFELDVCGFECFELVKGWC